jgi:hypothetical protein
MGMKHKEEYKLYKTCGAWSEDEIDEADWVIKLMFKDVKGNATLVEQVAIELNYLLGYNNVDYIPEDEILKKSEEIVKLIKL